MDDLGPRIAYTAVEEGTPVYDNGDQRIGVVERVVGDLQHDIFDGLIIHTHPLPGRHLFAEVDQIAELRERGVVLSVDRQGLREPPDEKPGSNGRDARPGSALESGLRRAWDWISGRRR